LRQVASGVITQEATYKWLVLIYTLPPEASSSRVRIWRKLKTLGAVSFRSSAYLLPFGEERYEIAQWLCQEIQRLQGEVTLFKVEQIENLSDNEVAELFRRTRNENYAELMKAGEAWFDRLQALPRESATQEVVTLEEIVHNAHLKDAEFGRDEVKGIEAVLKGLAATTADDHVLLTQGVRASWMPSTPVFQAAGRYAAVYGLNPDEVTRR
jgi:hypothetical protein